MTLTELTDQPLLAIVIGGRQYYFSELPIGQLSVLQTFLGRTVPHPIEAVKPYLAGLPDADRAALLEGARREARSWPPEVGTAAGAAALLGTEPGQVEALFCGLSIHHPEITRDGARAVYRALQRDSQREARAAKRAGRQYDGEGAARRIFAVLFGLDDPDTTDGPEPLPNV